MAEATAAGPTPRVRVEVLGPVRLVVGDEEVEVPGPKRRALLALLATAERRTLTVEDLVDSLWPDGVPPTARATLHSHVSRLRRHLGEASGVLEATEAGYRLLLDPAVGTDLAEARSLTAAANRAPAHEARRLLARAQGLWRGTPLAEFDQHRLGALAVGLCQLRQAIDEAHVAAVLDAGLPAEAVEGAAALAEANPLSESCALLLVRSLDAAGRPAEALRAGYGYRRRLVDETGLHPSPALDRLEQAIAGRTTIRAGTVARPGGPLHGRSSELAALHRLLASERLVTVLGPGGVGKTRLAIEVASGRDRVTGLWLASVTDPGAVPHALAAALDLRVVHGDPVAACAALLGAGPNLLLVDNCEHLLTAVGELVARLLGACPQLTVLATSRQPLGLAAEQQLRLGPLAAGAARGLDDLGRAPAAALFLERARRVRPGFEPSPGELALVSDIVRRLDGIPLALELAAGRLSSLELADIHHRLDRSLDLLGTGQGATLRRTLEWSYDLLDPHEQRLFRHLGVLPDGFSLATAEAAATDLELGVDGAAALAHLVDASMVEAVHGEPARYRMLDTMRAFAAERRTGTGEDEVTTEWFVDWALGVVQQVHGLVTGGDERAADRLVRRELGNLRAAWDVVRQRTDDTARQRQRTDDAVRIVGGLADMAGWRDLTEVWGWVEDLADDPGLAQHPEGSGVLGLAAATAWNRGHLDRAEDLAHRGFERAAGPTWRCDGALALVALSRGELADAVTFGTRAADAASELDQSLGVAALAAAYLGDLEQAAVLHARLAEAAGSTTLHAFAAYVAGEIDALAGRSTRAQEHYERAVALSGQSGASFVEGVASIGLLTLRARDGRRRAALGGYRHLIDYWERTGAWVQQWTTLRNLARVLRSCGDDETAALLERAADDAPDAPAVTDRAAAGTTRRGGPAGAGAGTGGEVDRHALLDVARRAIDRHLDAAAGRREPVPSGDGAGAS
jgi:predicted ATPase/DNA-binding SARP family transcriptional activator